MKEVTINLACSLFLKNKKKDVTEVKAAYEFQIHGNTMPKIA